MENEIREYLKSYGDFVTKVTSKPSLESSVLKGRVDEIDEAGILSLSLIHI